MKKIIALLLVAVMALGMFAACAKTPDPTTPRIKAGPELLQKASNRSASVRLHWPVRYRLMAVRAPTG